MIYRHFNDFELQNFHVDNMTMIYVFILTIFENEKFTLKS